MAKLVDIVTRAKFYADLVNSDRVTDAEWRLSLDAATTDVWTKAAAARPDFQVTSVDNTVVSGGTASFPLPIGLANTPEYHSEVDVVFAPDTDGEYSLGSFAWQNRKSPGGWLPFLSGGAGVGGSRARVFGNSVFIEPARRAAGTYRLWYVPQPKRPLFQVRLAAVAPIPAYTNNGVPGPGHSLTEIGNGALVIDGATVALGDRVLLTFEGSQNGIYDVIAPGSGGTPFILTRSTDFDQNTEIKVGAQILVTANGTTAGATNDGKYFEVTAFLGTVDTDNIQLSNAATCEPILDLWVELLAKTMAADVIPREDDLPANLYGARLAQLTAQFQGFMKSQRQGPLVNQPIDTDMRGPRAWWAGW